MYCQAQGVFLLLIGGMTFFSFLSIIRNGNLPSKDRLFR